jgi:hypothetical protein
MRPPPGQYPIELNRTGSDRSDEIARCFTWRAALSAQTESRVAIPFAPMLL